jgi:flagellar secretion chaperone FliS
MYQKAAATYKQTNLLTANPVKLVIMCYEGAIGSLKEARDFYIAKKYEPKAKALQKALDIIHEMNISLDLDRGGDIAKNLRTLYLYMIQILIEADVKKDVSKFDDVIRMLEELEDGWKEIASAGVVDTGSESYAIPAPRMKAAPAIQAWSA